MQLLDKLIDNGVDFSPPGATITVRLRLEGHAALIEVDNPGSSLPLHVEGRLFESLWQSRTGQVTTGRTSAWASYIVRLIAEFHGGEAPPTTSRTGRGAPRGAPRPLRARAAAGGQVPGMPAYVTSLTLASPPRPKVQCL